MVRQLQLFSPIGQARVHFCDEMIIAFDRVGAARDQVRAFLNQLAIPDAEFVRIVRAVAKFTQQTVALFDDLTLRYAFLGKTE